MGKVYKQGIVSPKGFDMSAAEPVDQRTIVAYKVDLLSDISLPNVYPGLQVQVQEEIEGSILREYKYIGGDRALASNWPEVVGGGGTVDPGDIPLKFTSFVFLRNIGTPATPIGGSYEDSVPAGWYDYVPAGTDPIWMSSAVFTQGDSTPAVWTTPILTEDTATTEYEYCRTADVTEWIDQKPAPPLESPAQRTYWHDDPNTDDDWMAVGYKNAGEYPLTWDVVRIGGEQGAVGDPGAPGKAYKQSIVFARSNDETISRSVVTGGGFSSPYPTATKVDGVNLTLTWYDGIPAGDAKVWMTSFVFNDEDHYNPSTNNIWATPSATTDTATQDFEFSHSTSQPQDPDVDPGAWHDIADTNDIWMATRNIANGTIGPWGITRIKGEAGEQGNGLDISGRDDICSILNKSGVVLYDIWLANDAVPDTSGCTPQTFNVPGVVNDAYLYVGAGNGEDGSPWDNIGGVTGTDAASYLHSTVFLRAATVPATPSGGTFADPVPPGWSDGPTAVGIPAEPLWQSHRYFSNDAGINAGLVDWSVPLLATDTVDYDFEYAAEQPGDATPLPPDQAAGGIWHNDPLPTDFWMAKGQKTNGTLDPTTWEVIRIKGEKGEDGTDGVPSFLSSAYVKTNNDISATPVSGGSYVSPIPTSLADGENWSDGIPAGDGAVWFTQVKFDQGDTGSPTKIWPNPTKVLDSNYIEYHFSANLTKPSGDPIEGADGSNTWWDDADSVTGSIVWMAIGSVNNGIWPTAWDKVRVIGETGADGLAARNYIGSSMFTRCDNEAINQVTATGGIMAEGNPGTGDWFVDTSGGVTTTTTVGGITYTYRDGIPARTTSGNDSALKVWMIQKVFNSVDDITGSAVWAAPTLLADNTTTDYQYHPGLGADHLTKPSDPSGSGSNPDTNGWYDSPDLIPAPGAFWMAQRNWSEGVSAQWKVYLIRGEDGSDGADGADGVDGVSPIVTDKYYSTWHPYYPNDPTAQLPPGGLDAQIGDPVSHPEYWTGDLSITTILPSTPALSTNGSYWYITTENGGATWSDQFIKQKSPVQLGEMTLSTSTQFLHTGNTKEWIRLATVGDTATVANTISGAPFDAADVIQLDSYPAIYTANWSLIVDVENPPPVSRVIYVVSNEEVNSLIACQNYSRNNLVYHTHSGADAWPVVNDYIYDIEGNPLSGNSLYWAAEDGQIYRIDPTGKVLSKTFCFTYIPT